MYKTIARARSEEPNGEPAMKRVGVTTLLVLVGVCGCATPSYNQGDSASQAAKATAAETGTTQASLDATMAALRDLMGVKEGDLKGKFDAFAAAFDKLSASVKSMQSKADDMAARATAHLEKWEKDLAEIKSEDIKANSRKRKADIEASVAKVKELAANAKSESTPLLEGLGDIKKVLGTDLTQGGLSTVRETAARLESNATALRATAVKFGAELQTLSTELSTGTPPPAEQKK